MMKNSKFVWVIAIAIIICVIPNLKELVSSKENEWKRAIYQKGMNEPYISGEAAIVLNQQSEKVLFSKNEHEKLYPASTTKIMTALLAIEKGDLEDVIMVGKEVSLKESGESTAYLQKGQTLTLKQLLSGLMLPSGNDAARTIAIYVANKEKPGLSNKKAMEYFVSLMNKRAKELGANESNFMNPHGLHHKNHFSTAYDLVKIASEAMKHQEFQEIVNQKMYRDSELTYSNRNKLLDDDNDYFYKGANGVKTGYTDEAGYCLVSSATRKNQNVIAVVLHSTKNDVWSDSINLLDYGFSSVKTSN
ncbi:MULTISPECIES: D-alanyl-D-alanine carboxypeptidase family protein [Bacillus]|uniref:D-alanyl-D-alanine carboxypeptidase family protein n=1 Tax=Bacillus TaxID=1386 RepID=UPI0002E42B0C|nr:MULTISPECIES: D-alanyl-D-alanine carboxypeptidase family protein [Bacillus]